MNIIGLNLPEQFAVFLRWQSGSIKMQNIKHHLRFQLKIIIREPQQHFSIMEVIPLFVFSYFSYLSNVAIGYKANLFILVYYEIIVFNNHAHIAGAYLFLPEKYPVSDSLVIAVSLFVGINNYDGAIQATAPISSGHF